MDRLAQKGLRVSPTQGREFPLQNCIPGIAVQSRPEDLKGGGVVSPGFCLLSTLQGPADLLLLTLRRALGFNFFAQPENLAGLSIPSGFVQGRRSLAELRLRKQLPGAIQMMARLLFGEVIQLALQRRDLRLEMENRLKHFASLLKAPGISQLARALKAFVDVSLQAGDPPLGFSQAGGVHAELESLVEPVTRRLQIRIARLPRLESFLVVLYGLPYARHIQVGQELGHLSRVSAVGEPGKEPAPGLFGVLPFSQDESNVVLAGAGREQV